MKLPATHLRRAIEVEGWLELGRPERALAGLAPLLETPGARPTGLMLKLRAEMDLRRFAEALRTIAELRHFGEDLESLDVHEGWCKKRLGDLDGAIQAMQRLLARDRRSAIGLYNLGCYLALRGELEAALEFVTRACGMDPTFREHAADESDLDPLRDDPRFRQLLAPRDEPRDLT